MTRKTKKSKCKEVATDDDVQEYQGEEGYTHESMAALKAFGKHDERSEVDITTGMRTEEKLRDGTNAKRMSVWKHKRVRRVE